MFPFKLALNVSTLFPYELDIKGQVQVAAEAGYEGIELWVKDIEQYVNNGGTIAQLKRYFADAGIQVVNAIAFFKWSDANDEVRAQAFLQAEKEMEMLVELGCLAVAAPPFGDVEAVTLEEMASYYAQLSNLGRKLGIEPYLEFWGRAKKLSRLSEALYVAAESGVEDAKLLLDPFHMYTGGSNVESLAYLNGQRIGIVHANDYPFSPAREVIEDRDRVFPGEGIAPSSKLAQLLYNSGYRGYLSLELFVESYGEQSAVEIARHGLEAMKKTYSVES
ncbi:xylose isomerase [Paenibacillus baekrokdamisoli]|uniref:Xylose isomerase n=1 Tax=Paenibacillus baekrokdamisoli TaxID=1712516 RepID=A0A3G9IN44_9BACL|nr:sugar phosphate isomerase/epimerase family protein [Paenibacillus baekrokdamisoli]MBB3071992.1 sugar phosphate isomerase/epimerase [Paenibacillus baekrokdamisoli]BBH20297.1 xylose isomerase [Paenibacillus baekrokdamisoli]